MRNQLYTERLEISITEGQKDKLKKIAKKKEVTVNQLIRVILEKELLLNELKAVN